MENSDIQYNVISQETENFIIHDIISQFMPMKNESNEFTVKCSLIIIFSLTFRPVDS